MILAFTGRRAQSMPGDLDVVSIRIRRLLTALAPNAVVGAAADGGDLLVLEAALGMTDAPEIHVILPTAEEVFREHSVEPAWRDRFDHTIELVRRRGTVQSLRLPDGSEAYHRANTAFLDRAIELADNDERAVVLVIARQGEGEMAQHLVDGGRLRNMPSLRIDPAVTISQQPRVFVATPYGTKLDPQRRIEVDCNVVYRKILLPVLENAQLQYRRADEEIDSGVVLQPMIEWLADANLVIGDLQTGNFNVGWELGLRHMIRARRTLLIRPAGTLPPFDLNALRHVVYRQDERGVSDAAAVEAWATLAPYLRAAGNDGAASDSPVDAVMDVAQWAVVRRRTAGHEQWDALRQQLALARDIADGDLMLEVLKSADSLDKEMMQLLQAEAGVGLVRLGRYDDALALLRDVVDSDRDVLRPDAHVNYALALYRPPNAGLEAYDAAQTVLHRVLVKRPAHPEVRAMLGAIAKRRLRLRHSAEEREPDLRLAMHAYSEDYKRNLNAYYEGINVVAIGVVLELLYDDQDAGRQVRELLPAVHVAATLAVRANPRDYWAAATLAECALHESLLGLGQPSVTDAYHAAGALRPPTGDLESTVFQLDFLELLGLPAEPLARARAELLAGAGRARSE
jgi:tetratricopeptide (TPR) repeat protein